MARPSKVEACMFCGEMPCACNKPAPKAIVPRKRAIKTPESVVEKPASSIREAMKAKAAAVQREPKQLDLDDETKAAIIVLNNAEMLSESDKKEYSEFLSGPTSVKVRASAWKGRRNGIVQDRSEGANSG